MSISRQSSNMHPAAMDNFLQSASRPDGNLLVSVNQVVGRCWSRMTKIDDGQAYQQSYLGILLVT